MPIIEDNKVDFMSGGSEVPKQFRFIKELNLKNFPAMRRLIEAQLQIWPQHEARIAISIGNLDTEVLLSLENQAKMILQIAEDNDDRIAELCIGYRFFCEKMILEAELFFRRFHRYERSTFEEAYRDIYSKSDIMNHYMNGLLMSGVFWSNHAKALHFYSENYLTLLPDNFSHLEIGPGHGTLLSLTAQVPRARYIEGWDISEVALAHTKRSLELTNCETAITLKQRDLIHDSSEATFDSVVVSEVLEHLEQPAVALKQINKLLNEGGYILVNMPCNSPAPDHLFLINHPHEVIRLVNQAGFQVIDCVAFPMTGYSLERCINDRLTVTAVVIARKIDNNSEQEDV